MIRNIVSSLSMFRSAPMSAVARGSEAMTELNYRVNSYITVLSSYNGAIHKGQRGLWLDAEASVEVEPGDMILLAVATSGGVQDHIPKDFTRVLDAVRHRGDLGLRVAYKIYERGQSPIVRIKKRARNYLVSMLTIRGADIVVDAKGIIDTTSSLKALTSTPRVKTVSHGALLSTFCYSEPQTINIEGQKTVASMKNGNDGLAIGISSAGDGLSKRIYATNSCSKEVKNDIAAAISLF